MERSLSASYYAMFYAASAAQHGPGALAEVALVTRREQVVLSRGSASGARYDVVDVEHDPRCAARATAVAAAEAVASEDPEAELGGEGIAGTPDVSGWQGASRTR